MKSKTPKKKPAKKVTVKKKIIKLKPPKAVEYDYTKAAAGRPTVMTEEMVNKLEEAFLDGATDEEACLTAGITKPTLYDYCKKHPDFLTRKEELKQHPKYTARRNITKSIRLGDVERSQWYLERKAKDEFSARNELTGKNGGALVETKLSEESAGSIVTQLTEQLNTIRGVKPDESVDEQPTITEEQPTDPVGQLESIANGQDTGLATDDPTGVSPDPNQISGDPIGDITADLVEALSESE